MNNNQPTQDELMQKLNTALSELDAVLKIIGATNWINRAKTAEKRANDLSEVNRDLMRSISELRAENESLKQQARESLKAITCEDLSDQLYLYNSIQLWANNRWYEIEHIENKGIRDGLLGTGQMTIFCGTDDDIQPIEPPNPYRIGESL